MTERNKRLFIAAAITLLSALGVGFLARAGREKPDENAGVAILSGGQRSAFRGGTLPAGISGRAAPRFTLDDARGGRIDTRGLRGRPYVVTFLYVNCKDICPLIGVELRQALEQLGPRSNEVTALAVSADGLPVPPAELAHDLRLLLDERA